MTFWKKNGLQLLTLVLCAVLLGLDLSQRTALSEVKSQLDNAKHQLGDLNNSMNRISDRVAREMAESVRLVTAHDLQVTGVDSDSRSLLTWVSVTLRQWGTDTGAILLVNVAGETTEVPMTGRGDGAFTADVSIPAEKNGDLTLSVLADTDGTITREDLGSWSDVAMLLPLRANGWGGGGDAYDGEKGLLTLGDGYNFNLQNREGDGAEIQNPVFRVYVNGILTAEQPAALDRELVQYGEYTYAVEDWQPVISCKEGDEVLLAYACTDENGLTYEFTHTRWTITESGSEETWQEDDDGYPRLTWPE